MKGADVVDMFRIHLENTRALDEAFEISATACKSAIARQDAVATEALTKTSALLLGARMENRLYRLTHEPGGYTESQRERILSGTTEEAWRGCVSEAFALRRGLRGSDVPNRLGKTDQLRHGAITEVVDSQIVPVITLRNALAHGQWHRALNTDRSDISRDTMKLLNTTRMWHLVIRANLLEHLVWLIHDLAVTKTAFERDFDKRWEDMIHAKRRLEKDGYVRWERNLVASYEQGRMKRRGATPTNR